MKLEAPPTDWECPTDCEVHFRFLSLHASVLYVDGLAARLSLAVSRAAKGVPSEISVVFGGEKAPLLAPKGESLTENR
jgi:hypothetical protein